MDTVIVGAGVGGLTTALSMHAAQLDEPTIIEAAPEIRPLGVGINVLPHAIRELDELGLADRVREVGTEVDSTLYFDRHGNRITAVKRGRAAGHSWPQLSMHRGALQMMLLEAVQERIGPHAVTTGARLKGFGTENASRMARWETTTGSQDHTAHPYDLLIGADGIRSTVRAQLYPGEGEPKWNNCLMFRGVARVDHEFLTERAVLFAGHHDQRFMLYPIKDTNGDLILNWGCTIRVDEPLPEHGNWNKEVDSARLLEKYEGWRLGSVLVTDIIEAADVVFQYPMTDRDPLPRWSFDRVTLLGDAAHPMYPSGSNGTSQAILDARVLAKSLKEEAGIDAALRSYENVRLEATAQVIKANREMGDMKVLQVVHERAPGGFNNISEILSEAEITDLMRSYQMTAGFDPQQLNSRESLGVR